MGKKYVIIADDLTGSNDTGIQFLKAGFASSVILDPAALSSMEECGAVVVDTESRNIPASEASGILERIIPCLAPLKGKRVIYKKVDSTLRGNIAAETAVLREGLHLPLTVFAPAYPRNKRTARDGLLLMDGVPVAETEMGRDSRKPVTTSSLAETLGGSGTAGVRPVSLAEIREFRIPDILRKAGGKGSFSFDTETDEDLQLIVEGVTEAALPEDVLWVGSAGMAEAMVASPCPVLLVMGSLSPKSALQARYVLSEQLAAPVRMNVGELLRDREAEESRLAEAVSRFLRERKHVLLVSSLEEEQIETGRRSGAGELVSESLAAVVSRVLSSVRVGGMFITGGEVAIRVVCALGAGGTSLVEEVEPGIPLVCLIGGEYGGLPLVTKAGGFGEEETMAHCVAVLSAFRDGRKK